MDDSLQDKTVTVYDYGYNIGLAQRLSREFGRVNYFCPWKDTEPQTKKLVIGDGIEGIIRVRDFFSYDVMHGTDLFVFPDIYDGDLQVDLVRRGKLVWGARTGEDFEYKRKLFAETLEEVGLPVCHYKVITGMKALKQYLAESEDKWIKVNLRGDCETWQHINYKLSQFTLQALEYRFGAVKEFITFTVWDAIKTKQEVAYDGFMVASATGRPQFPNIGFLGYEHKNMSHILNAIPYESFPEDVLEVNEKFAPKLAERYFRSAFGTEIKMAEDGNNYFLDATCRQPSPPGEIIMEMVQNLGEFMYHGAGGDLVELEIEKPVGVQVVIYSEWAQTNWERVEFPEELGRWVKLSRVCYADGAYNISPDMQMNPYPTGIERIGSVVALGDTIDEAIDEVRDRCAEIKGTALVMEVESLAECLSRIQAGEEQGIDFKTEVPEPSTVLENAG